MAKKQSRRTVSLNRSIFEAAKQEAARRNQTLARFVEAALVASGVPFVEHPQQTPAQAAACQAQRRQHVQAVAKQSRHRKQTPARVVAKQSQRRPSRERQLLGDGVANAMGFH